MFLSRLLGSSPALQLPFAGAGLVCSAAHWGVWGSPPALLWNGCPALSGQAGVVGLLPGTLAAPALRDVAPSRDGVFETGRNRFAF